MIRSVPAAKPHEVDVLFQSLFHLPAGKHPLTVRIDYDLDHHLGMVTAGAPALICLYKSLHVNAVNDGTDYPNRMILRNQFVKAWRQEH